MTVRSNLFRVSVVVPPKVATFIDRYFQSQVRGDLYGAGLMQTLQRILQTGLLSHSVTIPGRSLDTFEAQPLAPAPAQKLPYGSEYGDLNLSYYLAGKDAPTIRGLATLFHVWQSFVMLDESSSFTINPQSQWGLAYLSDYATDIFVDVLGRDIPENGEARVLMSYQFEKAWPIGIGDVHYRWGEHGGSVQSLPVSFTYQFMHPTPRDFASF